MGKHGQAGLFLLGLLLLFRAGPVLGAGDPSPAELADRVAAAHRAGEDLDALATRDNPDPWLVAEILCVRDEKDAARAFAGATRGSHLAGLAAYVAAWKSVDADGATREAVANARAFVADKKPAEALETLADSRPRAGTILAVQVPYLRGESHLGARDLERGADAFGAAGAAAESIGWLRRAGYAFHRAAACAHARSDPRGAVLWAEHSQRIWMMRPDHHAQPFNLSAGMITLGGLRETMTEYREARVQLEKALEILEPLRTKDLQHAAAHGSALQNLARVHRALGDHETAIRLFERSLSLNEGYRYRPGIAWALAFLGETEWRRGSPVRALPHLERALPLMRELKDARGTAFVLNWMGSAQAQRGETEKAARALAEALALAGKAGARWEEAKARHALGLLALRTESLDRAMEQLMRARELYRSIGDTRSEAFVLSDLARAMAMGDGVARAGELQEEAIRLAGGDRSALAHARKDQGDLLVRRGDYAAAAVSYGRAAELLARTGNRSGQAHLLNSQGGLAWRRGRLRESLKAFAEVRRILHETGDRQGEASAIENLGLVHASLGNLDQAIDLHLESLAVYQASGDRLGEAMLLLNLSVARRRLGLTAEALSDLEMALDLARDVGDRHLEALTLSNLASLRVQIGDPERGRAEITVALRLLKELGDRASLAWSRATFAILLAEAGHEREAKAGLEIALREQAELGADRAVALIRANLGGILSNLGEYEAAAEHLRAARAGLTAQGDRAGALLCETNLANVAARVEGGAAATRAFRSVVAKAESLGDRTMLTYALSGLAGALAEASDPEGAIVAARRACEEFNLLVTGFGEEQGAGYRARTAKRYEFIDHGVRASIEKESVEDLCFFLETGRAGTLRESLNARDLLRSDSAPDDLLEEEQEIRIDEVEALREHEEALSGGKLKAIRSSRRRLEAQWDRLRDVVARIQRAKKSRAGIVFPRADSLAEIRSSLRQGETLVEYGLHQGQVVALVVGNESARGVTLGDAATATELSRQVLWLSRPGARGLDLPAAAPTAAESRTKALAELRRRLIEPLGLDSKTRRVLISPDGILSYVPFRLLMDAQEIVHVPSGSTYRLLAAQQSEAGKDVLALGDPDYARAADSRRRAATHFGAVLSSLPESRKEVLAIGDLVLLEGKATEEEFVKSLARRPRWRAVHLACHGIIDTARPYRSALALTADESGDGFLTCLDIYRLEFQADLVVLSACETARGKIFEAEGIVGLMRAFLHAGAPTVLCSLWNVDDLATRALMVKFYELWRGKGLNAAEALRRAQDHVRSRPGCEDPYYWAAWVLWGLGD